MEYCYTIYTPGGLTWGMYSNPRQAMADAIRFTVLWSVEFVIMAISRSDGKHVFVAVNQDHMIRLRPENGR